MKKKIMAIWKNTKLAGSLRLAKKNLRLQLSDLYDNNAESYKSFIDRHQVFNVH